jgi:nucleoside-diphosphate-sugar epimerase
MPEGVFGRSDAEIDLLVRGMRSGIAVVDLGDQTRCFTYVDDAIVGTLLASESSAAIGEAFNIGSMTETTVGDVVALAIKIANVDSVFWRRSH